MVPCASPWSLSSAALFSRPAVRGTRPSVTWRPLLGETGTTATSSTLGCLRLRYTVTPT